MIRATHSWDMLSEFADYANWSRLNVKINNSITLTMSNRHAANKEFYTVEIKYKDPRKHNQDTGIYYNFRYDRPSFTEGELYEYYSEFWDGIMMLKSYESALLFYDTIVGIGWRNGLKIKQDNYINDYPYSVRINIKEAFDSYLMYAYNNKLHNSALFDKWQDVQERRLENMRQLAKVKIGSKAIQVSSAASLGITDDYLKVDLLLKKIKNTDRRYRETVDKVEKILFKSK